jgi:hypothetical protein
MWKVRKEIHSRPGVQKFCTALIFTKLIVIKYVLINIFSSHFYPNRMESIEGRDKILITPYVMYDFYLIDFLVTSDC